MSFAISIFSFTLRLTLDEVETEYIHTSNNSIKVAK